MVTNSEALVAAKTLKRYCELTNTDCDGCIFNRHEPDGLLFTGCVLCDPDHLPETWELEKCK